MMDWKGKGLGKDEQGITPMQWNICRRKLDDAESRRSLVNLLSSLRVSLALSKTGPKAITHVVSSGIGAARTRKERGEAEVVVLGFLALKVD
ncbi:hypothetical protein MRB53_031331 [Persea americana]|uniref:Uncharacterized protein n=1 Tax=Persea americana TaxID=3435 RepID=A0ACC2KPV0_PERAE|nr:hypothetical protein MRB53_031331 [Persea americana]